MSDPVAEARANIEKMLALSEAAQEDTWCGPGPERPWADRIDTAGYPEDGGPDEEALFIAAASPDRLARICTEALAVLDRHGHDHYCYDVETDSREAYPCPEFEAVIRAWAP